MYHTRKNKKTMRPNFKNIDITKDAFAHSAGKVAHEGENWITPELIPVKPVYTKEDLEGLEHLNYVAGLPPFLRGPYSGGQSVSMKVSRPQRSPMLSIVETWLRDRRDCLWHSTSRHTEDMMPITSVW